MCAQTHFCKLMFSFFNTSWLFFQILNLHLWLHKSTSSLTKAKLQSVLTLQPQLFQTLSFPGQSVGTVLCFATMLKVWLKTFFTNSIRLLLLFNHKNMRKTTFHQQVKTQMCTLWIQCAHNWPSLFAGSKRKEAEANVTTTEEDLKLAHMFETLGLSTEKANEVLAVLKSVCARICFSETHLSY